MFIRLTFLPENRWPFKGSLLVFNLYAVQYCDKLYKSTYYPAGCVPSAAVAISGEGAGCLLGGGLPRKDCLVGVSA